MQRIRDYKIIILVFSIKDMLKAGYYGRVGGILADEIDLGKTLTFIIVPDFDEMEDMDGS